jgi:plastocyanin
LNQQLRDRVLLPVAIPLGALSFIFLVAFGLSRILLKVPKEIATAVALMTAFNLVVLFAFTATRKARLTPAMIVPMLGVGLVPVLIGGAVAGGVVTLKEQGEKEHVAASVTVELSAKDLSFSTDQLSVPAGKPFKLAFDNKDSVPHNVAVYKQETDASPVFVRPFFIGPKKMTWDVPPIQEGSYIFRCQVHPTMKGTLVAAPGQTVT